MMGDLMRFKHLEHVKGGLARYGYRPPRIASAHEIDTFVRPSSRPLRIGHCPDCGSMLTRDDLWIESDAVHKPQRLFAVCGFCETSLKLR